MKTIDNYLNGKLSHPSWVRGLKLKISGVTSLFALVAPLVGAWIETTYAEKELVILKVAPLVGAWIETAEALTGDAGRRSRTPRGCVD